MKANPTTNHSPMLAQLRPQTAPLLRSTGAISADFGELMAGRASGRPESDGTKPEPQATARDEADDHDAAAGGSDADAAVHDGEEDAEQHPETPPGHAGWYGVDAIARELTHAAEVDLAAVAKQEMIRPKDPDKHPGTNGQLLTATQPNPHLSATVTGPGEPGGSGGPDSMENRLNGANAPTNTNGPGQPQITGPNPAPGNQPLEPASSDAAGAARAAEAARSGVAAAASQPLSGQRNEGLSAAELAGRVARLERLTGSAEATRGAVAGIERAGTARAETGQRASQSQQSQEQARSETGQRVLNAVQRGLASMLTQGGGRMTVVLRPEQLGEVRVRMETRQGSVRASMSATTDAARRTLESGIESLRSALESRGVRVESIEIERAEPDLAGRSRSDADARNPQGRPNPAGVTNRSSGQEPNNTDPDASPAWASQGIWTELGIDAVA
ncbi:MAG: flagellar hook-length control protein FliK [Phycisphaerales bacterium]|nr:flagellar hook-length control protein FliK [Planctomycetota bacterium]MCH8508535.1 flagellar hook-length control protein FliK [Phycisphaerales bacterium]